MRKLEKALIIILTGMAFMFIFRTPAGLQGEHYLLAAGLAVISYGWIALLYWCNFIRPLMREGME